MSYFNVNEHLKTRKLRTSLDILSEINRISAMIKQHKQAIEDCNKEKMTLHYLICPNFKQRVDYELEGYKEDLNALCNVRQQLDKAYNRLFKQEWVLKR